MADLTRTIAVKNGSVLFSPAAAASTQEIPVTKDESMCIYVKNGSAASINATVRAGTGIAGASGALVVAVAAGAERIIGPLESARFRDGSVDRIRLDISAVTSVTVGVIQL